MNSISNKIKLALALALLIAGVAGASDPFDPVIDPGEAGILSDVTRISETNLASAIEFLGKQDLATSSPALDYALGNLYFREGSYDLAEKAYLAALDKLPKFRRAMANLGRIYALQENYEKAIETYRTLARDGQADEEILLLLGHMLLMTDRAVSAENAYRQAMLLNPDDSQAKAGLAKCLLVQQRYREAVALLRELTTDVPGKGEYWALAANACVAEEDYASAIVMLECARRLDVADSEMTATLGDLYLNARQPAEAVAAYMEAFEDETPSVPRILRAAEGFVSLDETEKAERLLSRAEAAFASDPDAVEEIEHVRLLMLKAEIIARRGDAGAAMKAYSDLLARDPLNGRALMALGDLQWQANLLEEAVMSYERAARVSGFEAEALVRQARVEVERDRYSRAVELLETAQALNERPDVARYLEQVKRLTATD